MANPSIERPGHGSQGGVEGIAELLRCYICMERLTDATICPHCLKLGCFSCIKRWVTDNRSDCPHCRTALSLRDLIRIPLFDDIGIFLDSLRSSKKVGGSSSPSEEREKCPKHKQKTTVYCESCKKCICHECALWSEEHKNHTFKPLDVLYKKHKETLQAELRKLKDRMKDVLSHVQQMERKMEGVKIAKSKTKRDIHHMVEKMYSRLDEQAKEKHAKLAEYRHYLRNQAVEITKESHELEKKMQDGDIASLVNSDGELKPELKSKLEKLLNSSLQLEPMISSSDFVNEVCPTYDQAIMRISRFQEMQRKGEEIYSKPLHAHGLIWRLKVYPNGHREDFGNYLGVFVELMEGFDKTTNYQYAIEMLYSCSNKFPHKNYKREYSSDFANGESWGYKKFYELSKLQPEGFLKDDALCLKFSVRAPTYYQKCQDLKLHIDRLESDKDSLKQQLTVTRKQVEQLKTELKNEKRSLIEARSHSSPSHMSNSTLSESTSRISPRGRQHPPHHQHSHSAPHEHPPPPHTSSRGDGRQQRGMEGEETRRGYLSASQHHVAQSSPKRSFQHAGHSDSRLLSSGDSQMSHMMYPGRRRSTHNSSPDARRLRDQRRRSADPVIYDQSMSSYPSRSHTQPGRGLSQAVQDRHPRHHDLLANNIDTASGGEFGERKDYSKSDRKKREKSAPPLRAGVQLEGMFDSSSDDGGSNSQPDPLNLSEVYLDVDGEDQSTVKSASSTSTLTAGAGSGSPPRNGIGGNKVNGTSHQHHQQQQQIQSQHQMQHQQQLSIYNDQLSQETFDEDDHKDMLYPVHEGLPMYYEPHGHHIYHLGLSQPVSPLKSKHGKSLTDIHSAATSSNSNLHSQQFLSQSVIEFPPYHHRDMHQQRYETSRHDGGRYFEHSFRAMPMMKHSQSSSHGRLHRMSSDTNLNYDAPPGTKAALLSALSRNREEADQKREKQRRQHQSKGQQHLQNKVLQATRVNDKASRQYKYKSNSLESPSHRASSKTNSSSSTPPLPSSNSSKKSGDDKLATNQSTLAPPVDRNTESRNFGPGGKSASTSSLNLSQLL